MAKQYKLIHPVKYFRDYVNSKVRPDGREFETLRPIGINYGAISLSNGSAIVKIGNTNVMCGIREDLAKPKAENPEDGYIFLNIEFLPIHSKHRNNHILNDDCESFNCAVLEVIKNSNCINLKDLCICREKLVWALYLDVIVFENDGCLFDAALIACIVSLRNLQIPFVSYDPEINKIEVDLNKPKQGLKINSKPVSSTLLLFGKHIIIDPTAEEEHLSNSLISFAISNGEPCFVLKLGGGTLNDELSDLCICQALKKETTVLELFKKIKI